MIGSVRRRKSPWRDAAKRAALAAVVAALGVAALGPFLLVAVHPPPSDPAAAAAAAAAGGGGAADPPARRWKARAAGDAGTGGTPRLNGDARGGGKAPDRKAGISAMRGWDGAAAVAAKRSGDEKTGRAMLVLSPRQKEELRKLRQSQRARRGAQDGGGLAHPKFGTIVPTGRRPFLSGPFCSAASASCVAHYPEVDLADHLKVDEAKLLVKRLMMRQGMGLLLPGGNGAPGSIQQQQEEGGGGGDQSVIGKSVQIPPEVDIDRAILTRHGYKGGLPGGNVNQDRAIIVAPYRIGGAPRQGAGRVGMEKGNPDETDSGGNETDEDDDDHSLPGAPEGVGPSMDFFMGIFDGHGERGHASAHAAVTDFPPALAANLASALSASETAEESEPDEFDALVASVLEDTYREINDRVSPVGGAGCTASTVLKMGPKLYVANAGDSRSLIVTYVKSLDRAEIAYETREDKPDLPEERARIEGMGGVVYIPPAAQQPPPGSHLPHLSSRVMALLDGGMQIGLAMSRSLGDPEANRVGVIPDPIVKVLDIPDVMAKAAEKAGIVDVNDVGVFALSASDGLYDHASVEEIITELARSLYQAKGAPRPLEAAEKLILLSSRRWILPGITAYRDDISLAVSKVLL